MLNMMKKNETTNILKSIYDRDLCFISSVEKKKKKRERDCMSHVSIWLCHCIMISTLPLNIFSNSLTQEKVKRNGISLVDGGCLDLSSFQVEVCIS